MSNATVAEFPLTLPLPGKNFDLVPENVPRHPVPVVLLARLAVDRSTHGQGVGQFLLLDAMRRALMVRFIFI